MVTGLKITAGHRTMSDQDDYLSEQHVGLAVVLTGHVCSFQKIVRFISGKYKQLNHKISQRVVVKKWNADFAIFFKYGEKNLRFRKYSDMCGQGLDVFLETESVYNQNRIQRKS